MPNQSFLQGALVLALAGVTSRVLGVFYVVVLPRVLQGEGYGLYTAVKPVYHTLLILAVAGLPVAIAKMVADRLAIGDVREVRRVFWVSIAAMLVTGTLAGAALALLAHPLARSLLGVPDAALLLQAVAPAVMFLSLASALRGFFQGLQRMTPIAVSQVVEQVARVGGTVVLAVALVPLGEVYGAAGAMLGGVLGGACALLVLWGYYLAQRQQIGQELARRARPRLIRKQQHTLRQLVTLALPLVLGQILWPVFEFLDTLVVPDRLMFMGMSRSEAMTGLGYLGMAGQLMWFPNVLTLALAASLVPAIAQAWALHQVRQVHRLTGEAIRVAFLFGLPAAVGLFLLADGCAWLLFGFAEAGKPLAILAFGTLVIGLQQVTAGTLQGLGKVGLPVRNLLCGACVKFMLNWWLVSTPQFGVKGAAWGTLAGFATAAFLNYFDIRKLAGLPLDINGWFVKPLLATGVMGAAVGFVNNAVLLASELIINTYGWSVRPFVVNAIATLCAIGVGVLAYGVVILNLGGLKRKDVDAIPYMGPRWAALLTRRGWLT